MKINVPATGPRTAEGAAAARITPEQELRRTVAACMLWEDGFYESGASVADRIKLLIPLCRPEFIAACAVEARTKMKLRHVPLLLVREMARYHGYKNLVAGLLADVIQRPDELAEFLAIYWKDNAGKTTLSAQVKKGLARAFRKFNEYQLAKYNRDGAVKLRDVLFLCHSKPTDAQGINKFQRVARKQTGLGCPLEPHEELYRKLVEGKLETPDTWEVQLSAGADKRATFERLMEERKLGALAFLRNLRNMQEAGISEATLQAYAAELRVERVLPFRFLSAARYAPSLAPMLENLMFKCLEGHEKLKGITLVLIDVSGSMKARVSGKSEIDRLDAACGVAIMLRELSEAVVLTFSDKVVEVPPHQGFRLAATIKSSQPNGGTYLGKAIDATKNLPYDRLIVITDEQSHDRVPDPNPGARAYMINVASNKNGVGYGNWHHIDGWSEAVIDFIQEFEKLEEMPSNVAVSATP